VPTSGYFLLVPADEVTELNWSPEETLQAVISGGLTVPPEVRYFKSGPAAEIKPVAAVTSPVALSSPADERLPLS
jgi:uncharacterized membrane protein